MRKIGTEYKEVHTLEQFKVAIVNDKLNGKPDTFIAENTG